MRESGAKNSVPPRGPWSHDQIERYLVETRVPLRLACNRASGHPLLASLWYVPLEGKLWCATQKTARVGSLLAEDPRCTFEVAGDRPPYRGVRAKAVATLDDSRGEEILRLLIARYLDTPASRLARWLLARAENETAIAIEPKRLLSWDYTERMEPGA